MDPHTAAPLFQPETGRHHWFLTHPSLSNPVHQQIALMLFLLHNPKSSLLPSPLPSLPLQATVISQLAQCHFTSGLPKACPLPTQIHFLTTAKVTFIKWIEYHRSPASKLCNGSPVLLGQHQNFFLDQNSQSLSQSSSHLGSLFHPDSLIFSYSVSSRSWLSHHLCTHQSLCLECYPTHMLPAPVSSLPTPTQPSVLNPNESAKRSSLTTIS